MAAVTGGVAQLLVVRPQFMPLLFPLFAASVDIKIPPTPSWVGYTILAIVAGGFVFISFLIYGLFKRRK